MRGCVAVRHHKRDMLRETSIAILLLLTKLLVYGQPSENDTTKTTALTGLEYFYNQTFADLAPFPSLDSSHLKAYEEICTNLAGCFVVLEAYPLRAQEAEALYVRMEELASRFYRKGTPLILMHGLGSTESANHLSKR